jgi:magnesium-transporting ATPase (P-type)
LEQASNQISKYAVLSAILIVILQTIFLVLKCLFYPDNLFHPLFSVKSIQDFSQIVITGICILIVSVPEGLPLAVSIAMALSVDRLKKD